MDATEPFGRNARVFRQFTAAIAGLLSVLAVISKENITLMPLTPENVQWINTWTWFFSMALSTCLACIIARALSVKLVGVNFAGAFVSLFFRISLASAIPLLANDSSLNAPNTVPDEIVLSVASGYIFYDIFNLKLADRPNKLKALALMATEIFIWTFFKAKRGAGVLLALIFMVSAATPLMILSSFASPNCQKSKIFRSSVWASWIFSFYQFLCAVNLLTGIWTSSSVGQLEHLEFPLQAALIALVYGATLSWVSPK